ncbi:fumarate reductase flavoprotein subunit precursor [Clostridium puniceum]|uniref:Fumarate reductase flavoprotein subunit n=1 Tax=Clostridium puniceum TaxID=29367 RepID=A0A1S8T8L6_9CLOT|nr:FAD-dependent oxidoreductase [Clostridium puniceum]OOM74093.1 fumarate reductase flavoprotein subunit precursor [Clostridium puniceum]
MKEITCDVVVVAAGPAGLAAAISAAENDMSVVVFEKSMNTGGAANMGMGPLGLGTSVQRKELATVDKNKAFDMFMNYTHWRVDANLVRKYFDKSADTIDWLQDMGVEFYKASKYFPGSEPTWHIVKPESGMPGPRAAATMIKRMTEKAVELGVQFYFETPAKELIKTDGKITGVIGQTKDGDEIKANCKAAVIATGGFGDNAEMIKEYTGYECGKDYFGFRIPGLVGDGIKMAWNAGAGKSDINIEMVVTLPGENVTGSIHAAFNQPNLLVNLQGERFFNEEHFENSTYAGNAINLQKDRCAFMIIDESIKRQYLKRGVDVVSMVLNQENIHGFDEHMETAISQGNPYLFAADTIEELAEKTGINCDNLLDTIDDYNDACEGRDEAFGKKAEYMRPIRKGKFYATKFFPGAYGSLGGIKINHKTEVVTQDFEVIEGLYAAGTDTCTIYGDSYMFLLPGNTMGYALNSGRMAGENASDYLNTL